MIGTLELRLFTSAFNRCYVFEKMIKLRQGQVKNVTMTNAIKLYSTYFILSSTPHYLNNELSLITSLNISGDVKKRMTQRSQSYLLMLLACVTFRNVLSYYLILSFNFKDEIKHIATSKKKN